MPKRFGLLLRGVELRGDGGGRALGHGSLDVDERISLASRRRKPSVMSRESGSFEFAKSRS